jgi:hypothetical protein
VDPSILKGLTSGRPGEVHAIMGPNGSGKSTLATSSPAARATRSPAARSFLGQDLLDWRPRSAPAAGVFLAFQYPVEIPGVNNTYFLRRAERQRKHRGRAELDAIEFLRSCEGEDEAAEMDEELLKRAVNEGFSGGEKKRNEILQMAVLEPRSPSSTRPTPASTSTRSRSWRTASTAARPERASSSSPTTSACSTTSCPTSSTCWPDGRIVKVRRQGARARARGAQQPALAAQPLGAWSTALARDGAFVYLPQGVVLARPVQLLCLTTRGAAERVVQLRSLLIAEPTSELAVIESHAAAPDAADVACLVNSATELVVGANASVAHYLLQRAGQAATQLATVQATQHADSRLTSLTCVLGGALVRNTIGTRLAAPGAQSTLDGLFFAGGRQHVDNHTTIDHEQPRCASSECYKGILDGAATGVFNGKVLVRPQAQQTDARQSKPQPAALGDGDGQQQAAARNLRRRRQVQPWRDDRPARRRGAVLPASAGDRRGRGAQPADLGLRQ